ncbi:hypothetical protein [Rhodosalinus sp. FB01]|uniref:hypothetical protein n=1 Tax=Rhodosalinus sp. FB01 TaxID=3239194 RepID=UPI003523FFBC
MTDPAAAKADTEVLAQLHLRLAAELERLATLAASIDGAFAPRTARSALRSESLQDLDRLRQHCADIAVFQTRLAAALPKGAPLAAETLADGLQLRDVADRLTGRATGARRTTQTPGEVDLF